MQMRNRTRGSSHLVTLILCQSLCAYTRCVRRTKHRFLLCTRSIDPPTRWNHINAYCCEHKLSLTFPLYFLIESNRAMFPHRRDLSSSFSSSNCLQRNYYSSGFSWAERDRKVQMTESIWPGVNFTSDIFYWRWKKEAGTVSRYKRGCTCSALRADFLKIGYGLAPTQLQSFYRHES